MAEAIRDQNNVPVALGVSTADATVPLPFKIDSATGRLLVSDLSGGTVTSFSFTDGNGFDGTVTNPTTTPTLSLTTSLTTGSIPFIGAGGALLEDNADLFWNATTDMLELGVGAGLDLFNLKTDATNYERLKLDWLSSIARVWTQNDGTGSASQLRVGTAGTDGAGAPTTYTNYNPTGLPRISHVTGTSVGGAGTYFELGSMTLNGSSGSQVAVAISPAFSQTSTAAGTALLVNPSGTFGSSGGLLQSWQLGSSELARINSSGNLMASVLTTIGSVAWRSSFAANPDIILARDAAATLALRDSTTAQIFRVYNTYTDASNYERADIGWSGNSFLLQTGNAGTGVNRSMLIGTSGNGTVNIRTNNTTRWQITSSGHLTGGADNTYDIGATGATRPRTVYVGTSIIVPYIQTTATTVGALTAAATAGAGARAFVTDANAATFGTAAVGGGANAVPVYSDGAGWFIG